MKIYGIPVYDDKRNKNDKRYEIGHFNDPRAIAVRVKEWYLDGGDADNKSQGRVDPVPVP